MDDLIKGLAWTMSMGVVQVSMHGCMAYFTFKSTSDAYTFRFSTDGAEMDSEFTVRVEINTYLRVQANKSGK